MTGFFQLGGSTNDEGVLGNLMSFSGGGGSPANGSQGYMDANANLMNEQAAYLQQMRNNSSFGMNFNTMNNVMGGLSSLGQLWQSHQASKLAKDQWKTQKSVLNTNMMNQIQSYNNSLKDRLDSRAKMEGRDQSSADKQYEERQARRH